MIANLLFRIKTTYSSQCAITDPIRREEIGECVGYERFTNIMANFIV